MKQVKQLDFAGKTIFCGADVYKNSWSICLMMEGRILKRYSQPAKVEAPERTLKSQYPRARFQAVYEAGFCGFSPQRQFEKILLF